MTEMFIVYAIKNQSEKIYIGQTADLEKRLDRHNGLLVSSHNSYTKLQSGIWKLIYQETFNTRTEAMLREKELKSYQGRLFIKSLI
jgi:putative endonuclease